MKFHNHYKLLTAAVLSAVLFAGSAKAQFPMGGGFTNFPSEFSIGDTIDISLDIQFPGGMTFGPIDLALLLTNGTDTIEICAGTVEMVEPGHIIHNFTCNIPDDITLGDYTALLQTPFGVFAIPGGVVMRALGDHDVNRDGSLNIADLTNLISHIFSGGPGPLPGTSNGDLNCDGMMNIADVTKLIEHIFQGGSLPCYNGGAN